ncbi:hypothetical protein Tsubulata_026495 [Turnera subulata]|uniref:Homeobox domain-containing protein n=1 Tax=Turnera subulata TaxID=218843 RepID=A0A9Q0JHK8_9ROSI|nr:hypothetical protein Tsubulata_026495 [Turnera subulata]
MAQNLEPFHVTQQNRRTKLRVRNNPTHEDQQKPTLTPQSSSHHLVNSSSKLPGDDDLNCPPSSSSSNRTLDQGLSLSLSFQFDHGQSYNALSVLGDFSKPNGDQIMRSSVPFGPFTGYASVLESSRFLKPALKAFDDFCGVNCETLRSPLVHFDEDEVVKELVATGNLREHHRSNSKLLLMLDEVCRRRKLYCQQMESVVASFETVSGLENAAPYICYAVKIVSKHFTFLRNALLDKIRLAGRATSTNFHDGPANKEQNPPLNVISSLQNHNHACRSQKGLPADAVFVLKTWLFEHFLHPYPTDTEKQSLAQQTGLSRTQVSNWFINARVRLWKPMVEEVHMIESQQSTGVALESINQNGARPSQYSCLSNLHCTSGGQYQNNIDERMQQTKRSRNDSSTIEVSKPKREKRNQQRCFAGVGGRSDGVSLALCLQEQNEAFKGDNNREMLHNSHN